MFILGKCAMKNAYNAIKCKIFEGEKRGEEIFDVMEILDGFCGNACTFAFVCVLRKGA